MPLVRERPLQRAALYALVLVEPDVRHSYFYQQYKKKRSMMARSTPPYLLVAGR